MLILRNKNVGDLLMTKCADAVITPPGSLQDFPVQYLEVLAGVNT